MSGACFLFFISLLSFLLAVLTAVCFVWWLLIKRFSVRFVICIVCGSSDGSAIRSHHHNNTEIEQLVLSG